jgi:AcrR family transcriptional regulator
VARRPTYHHGDLRNALVESALGLLAQKGTAGLSVAEAARRAGVSTAAPYRHFASRTELLSAAATALATELTSRLEATQAGLPRSDDDPAVAVEALVSLTRTRIEFSLARGMGLELIYSEELRGLDDPERQAVTRRLFELYLWPAMTITADAAAAGRLLRQTSAIAQGYLSLARSQPRMTPDQARELIDEAAEGVRVIAQAARVPGGGGEGAVEGRPG